MVIMVSKQKSRSVRYAPHFAVMSVGYVVFSYASVPQVVIRRFDIDFVSVGLLMSAVLLAFTIVQFPSSRLVERMSTSRLLLIATTVHTTLAVVLDLVPSFEMLLLLRGIWGLAGGMILSSGATHLARLYSGSTATRQQGLYGGVLTFGGAVAFLITPPLVAEIGWFGVHSVSVLFAFPAIVLFWRSVNDPASEQLVTPQNGTDNTPDAAGRSTNLPSRRFKDTKSLNLIVLLAGFCYMATLGGYITLSTFITAYFEDLGVVGPLNVIVLLIASSGRAGGGLAVGEWSFDDTRMIGTTTLVAAVGFMALTVTSSVLLLLLPLLTMMAVSGPFGAIFNVAADASVHEGKSLSVVVAMGNFASLLLPPVTGMIRELTGDYTGAFLLLAGLNGIAVLAAIVIIRERHNEY
jgi:predicted MFS family arabinose efflux permease